MEKYVVELNAWYGFGHPRNECARKKKNKKQKMISAQ